MFALLDLIVFGVVVFGLIILITQIIMPASKSKKMFPTFRSNPLREEAEIVREQVDTMKDQNASLNELGTLLKERSELEKKIAKAKPVDTPQEQK